MGRPRATQVIRLACYSCGHTILEIDYKTNKREKYTNTPYVNLLPSRCPYCGAKITRQVKRITVARRGMKAKPVIVYEG